MQQKLTDREIISKCVKVVRYFFFFFTITVQSWQMVRKENVRKDPIYNSNTTNNITENKCNKK